MTFGVPVSLLDQRAALRERTQLDANDPLGTDAILTQLINAAIHRFQVANPGGWPWDFTEQIVPVTAGAPSRAVSMGLSASSWHKIRYVILREANGLWEYPLERTTRFDQLERYPNDSETGAPRTFSLGGSSINTSPQFVMFLRPVPDVTYSMVVGVQAPGLELSLDTDPDPTVNDHMIGEWIDIALDYAAFLVYRARGDLPEALAAKASFDEAVLQLRRTARLTYGAGMGANPLRDDRELS